MEQIQTTIAKLSKKMEKEKQGGEVLSKIGGHRNGGWKLDGGIEKTDEGESKRGKRGWERRKGKLVAVGGAMWWLQRRDEEFWWWYSEFGEAEERKMVTRGRFWNDGAVEVYIGEGEGKFSIRSRG
ncbi:hypothetical protein M9H77_23062 [Catharanthus roseus]|uniref:Uncharacterized protein n=1 Tax=Catharanthus roseus TaxID=4058 RepID=A0ACC0AT67_CATRO|nr:hypothetical protein M9H77_23062 [Catharanthus roseus]